MSRLRATKSPGAAASRKALPPSGPALGEMFDKDAFELGQAAFWAGAPHTGGLGREAWLRGWYGAAAEASRVCRENGNALRNRAAVMSALEAGVRAIKANTPAVPTPAQRRTASEALSLIEQAIEILAPPS